MELTVLRCNCCFNVQAAEEMVKYQLRHGNDLLAMDSLRGCDVSAASCSFFMSLPCTTVLLTEIAAGCSPRFRAEKK